jgi:hypothetical protein
MHQWREGGNTTYLRICVSAYDICVTKKSQKKNKNTEIIMSRLPKHYAPLHLYIPTHHQDFIY